MHILSSNSQSGLYQALDQDDVQTTEMDKLADVEDKRSSSEEPHRAASITSDAKGNTIVTKEDGETFAFSEKAERALVWKFDARLLPLLALMYLFNALDKSNLGAALSPRLLHGLLC